MHFLDFELINQPEATLDDLSPTAEKKMLVFYCDGAERRSFLFAILKAAGYSDPESNIHLVPISEEKCVLDLSSLLRRLEVNQVMIFGLSPKDLGLRLQLGPYVPVMVNNCWFMVADDLAVIRDEKEAGKPQKAGALWKAVKARFAAE
jgi:hypothetical protein